MQQMANPIIRVVTLAIDPSRAWPFPAGVLKITFKTHMLALWSPFCHSYTVPGILYYTMMDFLLTRFFFSYVTRLHEPFAVPKFSLGFTVTGLF